MKSRAILLLFGLMVSSSFVFGQVPIDSLQKDSVLPHGGLKKYLDKIKDDFAGNKWVL